MKYILAFIAGLALAMAGIMVGAAIPSPRSCEEFMVVAVDRQVGAIKVGSVMLCGENLKWEAAGKWQ